MGVFVTSTNHVQTIGAEPPKTEAAILSAKLKPVYLTAVGNVSAAEYK